MPGPWASHGPQPRWRRWRWCWTPPQKGIVLSVAKDLARRHGDASLRSELVKESKLGLYEREKTRSGFSLSSTSENA